MTILVSEIGVNFAGSYKLAHQMMQKSLECGANYVKIQARTPELSVPKDQWYTQRKTPWGETMSYIDYRRAMEFTDEQLRGFSQYPWFASVFDIEALERIIRFKPPFVKLPSCMLTNAMLLQATVDTGIPVILSTGMSTEEEISNALDILSTAKQETWVLHCNSSYPTKDEEVNLSAMGTLKKLAPFAKIGFSGHSVSPHVAIASIYLGAEMIEVHFVTDRTIQTSDAAASIEPPGLALIAREIKRSKKIVGDGSLKLYDSELEPKRKLRP